MVLDTGATASLISKIKCEELNISILPPLHKVIQVNREKLDVMGEIHTKVWRDKIELKFSALVVKKIATEALAGTGFHKENDVYSWMVSDRIVIKGKHYFNLTPPLVLNARVQVRNIITSQLEDITIPHSVFPVLIKSFKTNYLTW